MFLFVASHQLTAVFIRQSMLDSIIAFGFSIYRKKDAEKQCNALLVSHCIEK